MGLRQYPGVMHPLASVTVLCVPAVWLARDDFVPEALGWELNPKQKLGPRVADMGSSMDPVRLAESAADLNIRLMKWRAAPSLDIDSLARTRCLLLGAGQPCLSCFKALTLAVRGSLRRLQC